MNHTVSFVKKYWPHILSIIVPFLAFLKYLAGNKILFWGTPLFQFYPWQIYTLRLIQNHQMPLWNSLNGMGAPLLANYQLGFFYTPNWLIYVIGSIAGARGLIWGDHFLLYIHIVLACLGMVVFTKVIGLKPMGQAVSALAFGMSSYLMTRLGFFPIIFTASWLPWVVLCCEKLSGLSIRDILKKPPIDIPVIFCMILLAGHAQTAWYCLLLGFGWGIFRSIERNGLRSVITYSVGFLAFLILAAGLASIQLIPTAEYLLHSQRANEVGYENAMTYSFWPWRLSGLLFPDFFGNPVNGNYWGYATYWEDSLYIGVLPILLAVIGFIKYLKGIIKKDKYFRPGFFLLTIILVGLIFAFGKNTPIFPFLYKFIPTFSMFQAPARWLIWDVFGLAILSGAGLDGLAIPLGKSLYWIRLATAGAFAITLGAFLAWVLLGNIQPTFIRATALGGLWLCIAGLCILFQPKGLSLRWKIWAGIVLLIVIIDLLSFSASANPSQPVDVILDGNQKPLTSADLSGRVYISPVDEYQVKFGRVLRFHDYRPLEDPSNYTILPLPNLNLLTNTGMVNNFDPLVPERYFRLINALKDVRIDGTMPVTKDMAISRIYRINSASPSGFDVETMPGVSYLTWYSCSQIVKTEEDAWSSYAAGFVNHNGERKITIENPDEQSVAGKCVPEDTNGKLSIKQLKDTIVVISSTGSDGWLEISQTYYPGWEGTMDGHRINLYPANIAFTGLRLPPGNHEIVLKYNPISFRIGYLVTLVTILIVISWWGWSRRGLFISK